jgi:hypothetical protein
MNGLLQSSKLFVKRNASNILTCMGGVGVVATSVMAVKATPKVLLILEETEKEKGEKLTRLEKIVAAGPAYLPSIAIGVSTIACIFGANMLNKRHQAALMSAYALIDNSYKEYKEKVKELYGEEYDERARDEIAKDKYDEKDILGDDEELFYEEFSRRYFKSTHLKVQRALYDLNRELIMAECVTVNDYYKLLGLPPIDGGDEMGWSTGMNFDYYWQLWIDFSRHTFQLEDGTVVHKIVMFQEPDVTFEEYY